MSNETDDKRKPAKRVSIVGSIWAVMGGRFIAEWLLGAWEELTRTKRK